MKLDDAHNILVDVLRTKCCKHVRTVAEISIGFRAIPSDPRTGLL